MKLTRCMAALVGLGSLGVLAQASVRVPKGTEVDLKFDQSLNSRSSHVGDHVKFHVSQDVVVHGVTVIRAGTPAGGIITNVEKNGRYGKNATMKIDIDWIRGSNGKNIPVQPRHAGKEFGGTKTGEAAAATAGGAIVLGPIGLIGGYFIAGKQVHVKPGDDFQTEVARTIRF